MFSLTKTNLPSSVEVDGRFYQIKTDFHWWLRFHHMIKNQEIKNYKDVDFLYDGRKPYDRISGYEELLKFLNPEKKLPRPIGSESKGVIVYDYEIDSALIYSAFMELYHIDLLKSDMHWFKFLALMDGLHGTRFNEVVSYRCFNKNDNQSYEESMEELKQMWEIIPEEEELKVQHDLDHFNQVFFGC
ncbi:MAG: bacteriophage Gp15 family protein [Treponema sp.]|nr:bacteriophage Gp15 family protein [Treponema sp.]